MLKRSLLALALFFAATISANAASCFWVGGTGNWDNSNTASWASTTNGSPGTCAATGGIPKNAADTANFDASSCAAACTITVCGAASANCPTSSGQITITQITFGACTNACVLDFSANNPNVSSGVSGTGTGTRTFLQGSGIWTVGSGQTWSFITTTNLTYTPSGSIVLATGVSPVNFFGGGKTYPNVTLNSAGANASYYLFEQGNNASVTITNLTVNAPANILMRSAQTFTVTNAFNWVGTASQWIYFNGENGNSANSTVTFAAGAASTCQWCAFRNVSGSTSTITATNSVSFGNTGGTLSIAPPSGGGGGFIIGG